MGNVNSWFRRLKEGISSRIMGASRESEILPSPAASETEHVATSSPIAAIESSGTVDERASGSCTSIEESIQRSKSHWSELKEPDPDEEEVAEISNVEVFRTLEQHPLWGEFFWQGTYFGELVVGKKFAQGGQAELYEAQVKWWAQDLNEWEVENEVKWVLKVFNEGTFLRDLQATWPQGLMQVRLKEWENSRSDSPKEGIRYHSHVHQGILLKDGRFAFLMRREHADLRSVIDRKMLGIGEGRGPFSKQETARIMYHVAKGMEWLHNSDIIHRDLKASNVLVRFQSDGSFDCLVADYECSVGVEGTTFFRAPEILQALKDRKLSQRPEVYSVEADIYGYGMLCYEILTGKLPFEDHLRNDYDLVLSGQRPELPNFVDDWARELLSRCWQSNPADRPSVAEILKITLKAHRDAFRNPSEPRPPQQFWDVVRLAEGVEVLIFTQGSVPNPVIPHF